jgi:hypothetical protein
LRLRVLSNRAPNLFALGQVSSGHESLHDDGRLGFKLAELDGPWVAIVVLDERTVAATR